MAGKLSHWIAVLLIIMVAGTVVAQDDTTTTTSTTSNFNGFIVICETQVVVNLDGTMQAGYDMYYQVFSGSQGTGTALTGLRRVAADGAFTFSEVVPFNGGSVAFGAIGSTYVTISREGNPDNSMYSEYIDDLQDGCADPINPLGVSSVAGDGTTSNPSAPSSDFVDQSAGTTADGTSAILSPFGGVVNPNYVPPAKPLVVVGEREPWVKPRQETPGLIFAECNAYPVAEPGIIYDTDDVIVFWSWYADTEAQVQDHIDNADYSITYFGGPALPNVQRTAIQLRSGNYWVFFYSRLGNLLPGQYYIDYNLTWEKQISDGFNTFGPDTDNELLEGGCTFEVLPNPYDQAVNHNSWPYQR